MLFFFFSWSFHENFHEISHPWTIEGADRKLASYFASPLPHCKRKQNGQDDGGDYPDSHLLSASYIADIMPTILDALILHNRLFGILLS